MLTEDFAFHSKRDCSKLMASILSFSYMNTIPEFFHTKFTATFWVVRGRNKFAFYDSPSEHDDFAKTVGENTKDINFAHFISNKLIEYSDKINAFIKKTDKDEMLERLDWFAQLYQEWFAYHQAVCYSSNYLSDNFPELKEQIDVLHEAYAYNEMVAPKVDEFFMDNGIDTISYRTKEAIERDAGFLCLPDDQIIIQGELLDEVQKDLDSKINFSGDEVKGKVAYDKTVTGYVQVIPDFDGLVNVKEDAVLVTHLTQPQFNKYCKKAKAIVTDYGGLSSHSAILAREAKIPCIVGTKIATKVLKDGDLVKVDTKSGVVSRV